MDVLEGVITQWRAGSVIRVIHQALSQLSAIIVCFADTTVKPLKVFHSYAVYMYKSVHNIVFNTYIDLSLMVYYNGVFQSIIQ